MCIRDRFCTVPEDCVIENRTLPVLYQAPMMLEESHLSDIVCRELSIGAGKGDMTEWQEMLERIAARKNHVKIALVGKYVKLHDAYLSVAEALQHGGYETGCFVDIDWVDSEEINDSTVDKLLGEVDGIIPVSYTHLDVYKRQPLSSKRKGKYTPLCKY